MSRSRYVLGLALAAVLVALAVGGLAVSSASAATAPALKVCKPVPLSGGLLGLYSTRECLESQNVLHGAWAWAWADNGGKSTIYCVLGGTEWGEGLCESKLGTLRFLEHLVNEPFPKQEGLILLSILKSTVAGLSITIHCEQGSSTGAQPLTATLISGIKLTYTSCLPLGLSSCEVASVGAPNGTIETKTLDSKILSLSLVAFVPEFTGPYVELEFLGPSCAAKGTKFPVTGEQRCEYELPGITEPKLFHLLTCLKSGSKLKLGAEKAEYEGTTHVKVEGDLWWKIR